MTKGVPFQEIVTATEEFFALHWQVPNETPPAWCEEPYTGMGNIPAGELPGCYALLRDSLVVYIGSGISRGNARYPGCGLASRVRNYTQRLFGAGKGAWSFRYGHAGAHTIGFARPRAYLASALEQFLLARFAPRLEIKRWSECQPVEPLP